MTLLTPEQQKAFDATLRKRHQLEAAHKGVSVSEALEKRETHWVDGHGVHHSRASGRGKKGDETMRVLSAIDESPVFALDSGDPNYDSTEEPFGLRATDGDGKSDVIVEYKRSAEAIINEFFTSSDIDEAWARVEKLDAPMFEHFFVKRLVTLAMDRGHREKEAAARMLSALYPSALSGSQVQRGFVRLVEAADDLAIDVPDAAETLGMFIARAIIDDVLPPSFPDSVASMTTCEGKKSQEALLLAHGHLSGPGHIDRVLHAWGDFDKSPLDAAKSQIKVMLEEYLVTNDVSETRRCLHDLQMPFFHHEFVKRALTMAIEAPKECNTVALLLGLIKVLADSAELTSSQIAKGFSRIDGFIDDLSLDVPDAKNKYEHIKQICTQHNIVEIRAH